MTKRIPRQAGGVDPPDRSAQQTLARLIDRDDFWIAFQPIVDLRTGEILGLEALTRLHDTSVFASPADLYDTAWQMGMLADLETRTRRCAFQTASRTSFDGLLFMNNSPHVMAEEGYFESVVFEANAANLGPHRLVLEITERTDFTDLHLLQEISRRLREAGFQIALDDVGAGISGLNRILALRPNWVKLDRELTANVDREPMKQNLLRSFVHFARLSNMALIAEGIERREELASLIEMGVKYGQGYYLARPGSAEQDLTSEVKRTIVSLQHEADARRYQDPTTIRAAVLATPVKTYDQSMPAGEVLPDLAAGPGSEYAVILDRRRYLGLVERELIARCCGEEAAPDTPVGSLKRVSSPLVGSDTTLAEALELAAARPDQQLLHPLVVQHHGRVVGSVTLRRLLQSAAETHRRMPSHQAALTGLPSRVQADQWVAGRIRAADPCNIAFVDLRDFDAYNVAYGFAMGDAMLLRLVGLMKAVVVEATPQESLLAHLGEDRFMIAQRDDMVCRLQELMQSFTRSHREFFSGADLTRGAFSCTDPAGEEHSYPLTTVRTVYLEQPLQRLANPRELQDLARQLRLADHHRVEGEFTITRDRRAAEIRQRGVA